MANHLSRICAVLLIVGIAATSLAIPRVLIVQNKVAFRGSDDPNHPISNLIAAEFDELAKLEAIVWSLTDPVLRAASTAGKFEFKDAPTRDQVFATAKVVDAEYVIFTEARRDGRAYKGKIELFKDGKSAWKDEQNIAVKSESLSDVDSSLRSLARSLVLRLNNEALKSLPSQKAQATPELLRGQAPISVSVPPAQPVAKDNGPVLREAQGLITAGKVPNAIAVLRDAVDSDPQDPQLRIALVNALMGIDAALAAAEARSSAGILAEASELRVLAARAWMRAGKPDEAQTDLNEAMARNPDAPGTRMLLGEIGIAQLKPERSLEHLTKVIEGEDAAEPRFLRAMAYALAGTPDGLKADLDQLEKFEPKPSAQTLQSRYDFSADVLDRSLQLDANAVRALVQRAIVKPNDKEVLNAVELARRQIRSRATLGERIVIPEKFRKVQEQRLLAYKLMAQSLTDLLGYMAGGGEESLTDSRINLGEAIRNASEARAAEVKARS